MNEIYGPNKKKYQKAAENTKKALNKLKAELKSLLLLPIDKVKTQTNHENANGSLNKRKFVVFAK